jgi:8-oxo-dGTP pyrophosphatase MutT (NUDIX family)
MDGKPHVTVAAIIERENRFLMVEEESANGRVINQPAGHLENGETLIDAVKRETLEETAWTFEPDAIVGLHLWRHPVTTASFLRISFSGRCLRHDPSRILDTGILRTLWLSKEELAGQQNRLRSPLVLRCINDYLDGERHPLSLIKSVDQFR